MAQISYVRQKEAKGLGHAVLMAKELVGDEPFAVILPDDVIDAPTPCLKQMIDVFEQVQGSILATQVVEGPAISAYGVLDGKPLPDNPRIIEAKGMVEKPKLEDAPSKNAIIGRYILTPAIFALLEKIEPGAGGRVEGSGQVPPLVYSRRPKVRTRGKVRSAAGGTRAEDRSDPRQDRRRSLTAKFGYRCLRNAAG